MFEFFKKKGGNLPPNMAGFDLELPVGVAKCMKCGDIHSSRSRHECGGQYNSGDIPEPVKPTKSGLLKA